MATESAITGKAADKVTLTAASAIFSGTTYGTEFISGVTNCPSTYQTASTTVLTSTTTKTSTSVLTATVPAVTAGTSYLICSYNGTTASSSTLAARGKRNFTPYDTTLTSGTMNPTGGSSGTATTVTITAPSALFTGTPAALVSYNTCPSTYVAGSTNMEPYAAVTTKISTSKIAVTIPSTAIVGSMDVTTPWNVCVYASSSTGALVLTPITYSVAAVLSVSSATFAVGSGSAASTGSGPAQGGSSITIAGLTGIPTTAGATLSATLGGSAINSITAIDATSFSGTTTAHAAGAVNLTVTTAAGTKSTTTTPYSFTYGVTITPNTGGSGTTPILDITGAGFSSLVFADVADATALDPDNAYVLLTDNTWNAQTFSSDTDALDTKSVSYCNSVLQISDAEIICTLDLANSIASVTTNTPTFQATDVPVGTYTVTVVNSGEDLNAADFDYSIVSSGSTFTVAPY
jgi:hypothetical protein